MQTILIATHMGDGKDKIIEKGIRLAELISGPIILLTVIDNKLNFIMPELVIEATTHWEEDLKYVTNEQNKIKEQFKKIQIETIAVLGNPGSEIIKQAIENEVSVIVMGTHGRTGILQIVMGSTAEYVIRHSTIPVLVIPMNKYLH
ncbi:MAG: universal stress protein [Lacibacter sp.]|jgi:nucleotide-binding universal stress UspA family protein